MKKLSLIITLLTILFSSSDVLALTKGNYIGIDLIHTHIEEAKSYNRGYVVKPDNEISFGLNYKYAFNFNRFFIAPAAFFDYSNNISKDFSSGQVSDGDNWDLDYRYGGKLYIGYDMTRKYALFAGIGLVSNKFEVDWKSNGRNRSDFDTSVAYEIGGKYSLTKNIDLNLAYEISDVVMRDTAHNNTKFDIEIIRLGLSYNF